jgi:hypothetical protein
MSYEDNGGHQPNGGADNAANQMDNAPDLSEDEINAVTDEPAREKLSSTAAQKKHWRDKAKQKEAELEAYKKAHPDTTQQPPQKPGPKKSKDDFDPEAFEAQVMEKIELKQTHQGFDDADYKKAQVLAASDGKSVKETVDSPFFQAYLNDKRTQAAAARASADPSNRSGNSSRDWSKYEKDPTLVRSMSAEEHKSFIAWQKAKGGK